MKASKGKKQMRRKNAEGEERKNGGRGRKGGRKGSVKALALPEGSARILTSRDRAHYRHSDLGMVQKPKAQKPPTCVEHSSRRLESRA